MSGLAADFRCEKIGSVRQVFERLLHDEPRGTYSLGLEPTWIHHATWAPDDLAHARRTGSIFGPPRKRWLGPGAEKKWYPHGGIPDLVRDRRSDGGAVAGGKET